MVRVVALRPRAARAARALLAALLLLAAHYPLQAECGAADGTTAPTSEADTADEVEPDDDSDSAPFMIVVEHVAEDYSTWRCSGSLVSLRTGVTSAECARGVRPTTHELWVLAAATAAGAATRADGARRVKRIATAGATQQRETGRGAAWTGALLDLAVLELEKPFGSWAHARPILMATAPQECASGDVCHVVRALPRPGGRRARLRIVDATLAPDTACAQLVRYWAALRDRALCLSGPELCEPELGAGVVCSGKLCGVVSKSAGAGAPGCGDTHAAQSVARWRRFLHCAHTLRACGRGACAELCNERRLLDDSGERAGPSSAAASAPPASSARATLPTPPLDLAHLAPPLAVPETGLSVSPPTRVRPLATVYPASTRPTTTTPHAPYGSNPTRTRWPARPTNRTRTPAKRPFVMPMLGTPTQAVSVKPSPLFEPNRPDFKAGEYGDNAADYGAPLDEGGGGGGGGWGYPINTTTIAATTTTVASNTTNTTLGVQGVSEASEASRRPPALQPLMKPAAPAARAPTTRAPHLSIIIFLLLYQIL